MGHLLTRTQIQRLVAKHGREVIEHRHMQIERCCYQHGNVTPRSNIPCVSPAWLCGWPTAHTCGTASTSNP